MKKTKIMKVLCIILILFFSLSITVKATINPDDFQPGAIDTSDAQPITDLGKTIADNVSAIGIVVAVITLIVLGLKYMMGSVSEKAEFKKSMIPYLIGVVILVGITQFLNLILTIVQSSTTT